MEGALCKKAEGGVGVGNIVGKFGGVFKVGLEAVREERASKSGGPNGLSEEAEACCDFNTSGDWLPVNDGAGYREGVQEGKQIPLNQQHLPPIGKGLAS